MLGRTKDSNSLVGLLTALQLIETLNCVIRSGKQLHVRYYAMTVTSRVRGAHDW